MKCSAEWFSLDIFWYCETKKLTEDRDINHEIKETSKVSTTKRFGTESQKKFRRKHLDTLLPLIHKLLAQGKFLNHSTEWFPFRNFMVVRDNLILTEDPDITHELKETLKDCTTKNFRH